MTPYAVWGGSEGSGNSQRECEEGDTALATLPIPAVEEGCSWSRRPAAIAPVSRESHVR